MYHKSETNLDLLADLASQNAYSPTIGSPPLPSTLANDRHLEQKLQFPPASKELLRLDKFCHVFPDCYDVDLCALGGKTKPKDYIIQGVLPYAYM